MKEEKNLEDAVQESLEEKKPLEQRSIEKYLRGCINPKNAQLYGTFQQRAALNITQFPKIQGSLLIRMGLVYPLMSYLVEKAGIPQDCHSNLFGIDINYHTWFAGYLAYLTEIQCGMSKYPLEALGKGWSKIKDYLNKKDS